MKYYLAVSFVILSALTSLRAQDLPKAKVVQSVATSKVKIYTVVAPPEMFTNTTHVIELPHELIVIDGQFFAPYALQVRKLTDSLKKPIARFYISHDHPDHYIGFGDAFPDVPVYALQETKENIEKSGQNVLEQRQKQFGAIIANKLNIPSHVQKPGREVIDGVTFLFEESKNNEDAVSLVVKIPEVKTNIVQDIVYNRTHLFISGNTEGWQKALRKEQAEKAYTVILPGHGDPTDRSIFQTDLEYLDFANKALAESLSKKEFKSKLMAQYPDYGGDHLIDVYLQYYLKKDWMEK